MRKILLAGAAILGGSAVLAPAWAQDQHAVANPSQGQLAAPYGAGPSSNNNNNAWGIANTPSGSPAAGTLSTEFAPNVIVVPAPGTIVIRLNGRVEADVSANFSSLDKGLAANGKPNGYKVNPIGVSSYMRLYPGFDGVSANGLRYGATVELRTNFGSATTGTTSGGSTGAANGPSANTSAETVFVRRAFSYLAADQVGLVRLGQGDGVLGLFDNCIFTSQCWDAGQGVFDGGGSQQTEVSGAVPPFVWLSQSGADYGNNKIVYLTPQYFGFDFGLQYAPNEGNSFSNSVGSTSAGSTTCNQAGPACINVSSGNDPTRWINQTGVGLRYQHSFGVADFKTYGFYEAAGKEDLTTTAYVRPSPTASTTALRYDNLSFYKAGVAVTAFDLTAAVDYIGGAINGTLAERPTGGVGMNAITAGLTYAKGPVTLGATWGVIDSQGDARLTGVSQRHEYEVAFGGNYKLAPGVQLVGEYQYAHRHQGGYDFAQGAPGVDGATRDAQYQGLTFSTVLTW